MTDTSPPPPPAPISAKKLLIGGGVAILAAAFIGVGLVLPAEFGIDPTGIGKATGLLRIANPENSPELERGAKRTGVLTLSATPLAPEPGQSDHWEFELGPYESIEFKYTIPQGKPIVFAWQASAPLHYDMHAHPFDGGTDLTESYGVSDTQAMQGRYVAAFTGIHGWYWQNRTLGRVKLTLDASGAMTGSTLFDSAGEHDRPLVPKAP